MSNKCQKVKYTCGSEQFATCVNYEGTVNTNSSLANQSCYTVEETTQDIYNQLGDINLSELGTQCLTYVQEDGRLKVKKVLLKYEDEICKLKTEVEKLKTTAICDTPINQCGIDFKCLSLPCSNNIVTLKDLLQAIINKNCP